MSLKICVYMIVNGEHEKMNDALTSAWEADEIFVFDTADDEKTKDLCDDHLAEYNKIYVKPWRFDVARNTALSLIPLDYDICVALDADETLADGWREEIERVWRPGETTVLRYMYDWSQGMVFPQAKVHSREGYHWVYAAHERLHYYPIGGKEVFATTDKFLMYHHPDLSKPRSNYLPLLAMAYREYPTHKQMMFYYGRELWKASLNDLATKVLDKYLELAEKDENRAEVSYAIRILATIQDKEELFKWAIDELPTHREPYIWYADWLYKKGRYKEALTQTYLAIDTVKERTTDYTVESRCWDGYPYHLISWCYHHLNQVVGSIVTAEEALEMEPNNEAYKLALEKFTNEQSIGQGQPNSTETGQAGSKEEGNQTS